MGFYHGSATIEHEKTVAAAMTAMGNRYSISIP